MGETVIINSLGVHGRNQWAVNMVREYMETGQPIAIWVDNQADADWMKGELGPIPENVKIEVKQP